MVACSSFSQDPRTLCAFVRGRTYIATLLVATALFTAIFTAFSIAPGNTARRPRIALHESREKCRAACRIARAEQSGRAAPILPRAGRPREELEIGAVELQRGWGVYAV